MTDYAAAWDKLREPLKDRLRADPGGPLSADDVGALARAGVSVHSVTWTGQQPPGRFEIPDGFRDFLESLDDE